MRKLLFFALGVLLVCSLAFAKNDDAATNQLSTYEGVLIDSMCAGNKSVEELEVFVKTHSKDCAVMPDCAASGYNILTDGKLLKFDDASNNKVTEFLSKDDNDLSVEITAETVDGKLSLVSIANQKK